MPPEHWPAESKTARDLAVGEEGYVDACQIVISEKNHKTYVGWEAGVYGASETPHFSSTRAIRRLERGFSLTVRPGDIFRTSPLPWGMYGPVIKIVQTASAATTVANQNTDGTALPVLNERAGGYLAKLPEQLIAKQPRTLADLRPGERATFPLHAFKIDADHNLFASLSAELDTQDSMLEYGEIWRDEDGTYHADLKGTQRKWKPEDLRLYSMTEKPRIVPIATIVGAES